MSSVTIVVYGTIFFTGICVCPIYHLTAAGSQWLQAINLWESTIGGSIFPLSQMWLVAFLIERPNREQKLNKEKLLMPTVRKVGCGCHF